MISKNIAYGSLEIDPENGKLWLNCPSCLLRIHKLKFRSINEKFSMIDINGNEAWMLPGGSSDEEFTNFLESLISIIVPKISDMNIEKTKIFLDDLFIKIKKEVDNVIIE